jgi:hypothetical protein
VDDEFLVSGFEFLVGELRSIVFEFFGLSVAGEVGQKLSKVKDLFGRRILIGGCWRRGSCRGPQSFGHKRARKKTKREPTPNRQSGDLKIRNLGVKWTISMP